MVKKVLLTLVAAGFIGCANSKVPFKAEAGTNYKDVSKTEGGTGISTMSMPPTTTIYPERKWMNMDGRLVYAYDGKGNVRKITFITSSLDYESFKDKIAGLYQSVTADDLIGASEKDDENVTEASEEKESGFTKIFNDIDEAAESLSAAIRSNFDKAVADGETFFRYQNYLVHVSKTTESDGTAACSVSYTPFFKN
jgi:hypothetical protein